MLYALNITHWQEPIPLQIQQQAVTALESGQVIFLPELSFELQSHEQNFLVAEYANPKTKNISYDIRNRGLRGAICTKTEYTQLSQMMERYASCVNRLLHNLLPNYQTGLEQARTSYRPVEIIGRKSPSYRKDDTRLHVDAFPSTPTRGRRILRVFTNVNKHKPRIWRLGASFPEVVEYFHEKLRQPFYGSATLLNIMKITKTKRTPYDHYMLQLHNAMKADLAYQKQVSQMEFRFPAGSTWVVFTDQVSHAAISGQFTFEQTFHLPGSILADESTSPLRVLENFLQQALIEE